jgi:hypothetical protein
MAALFYRAGCFAGAPGLHAPATFIAARKMDLNSPYFSTSSIGYTNR